MNLHPGKKACAERLIEFLEDNRVDFFGVWQESIAIDQADIYIHHVTENGLQMYELVKRTITDTLYEEDVKSLAYKVAKQRVEANINIGDFVYNVNLGRSIIVKYVNQSGISVEELRPFIDKINLQFDLFCYHAVTRYTELKNKELQEKTLFIDQTHKDRLAVLGQMSSSFVHEFRNPLTSVIGFIKLLKEEDPTLKYIDIIELELDQLKFRITQFLHTSKMGSSEIRKEKFTIVTLLEDIENFLYPSIVDNDVEISTHFTSPIEVYANKDEIKQVFLNIILNSIDAVKQIVKPRKVSLYCDQKADEVIIRISNNGPIIPPEIRKIIFEPFYTTKELGTGIGLFVCKNIIEKHSGSIICDSTENSTTFSVYLPLKSV